MRAHFALSIMAAGCLLAARAVAADNPAEETRKLVAILRSDAPLFEKARACQQLGEFGGPEAVPALAGLLADEHLSAYARSGLEGIPDPSAAEALRTAAGTLQGDRLAGVVNSLAVLRDPQAVGRLRELAEDPSSGVVRESLLALGRIATDASIDFLRQVLAEGSENNRADAAAGCLLAAEQVLADGDAAAAGALYDAVRGGNVPAVYRAAATRGAIAARKDSGIPLLIEQLSSPERLQREAALMAIREIPSDALAGALNDAVRRASGEPRVQLLIALVDCHNAQSLRVLEANAASEDAEVRQTALRVLGRIGGAREAAVLLNAVAINPSAEEVELALGGLRRMDGADIDGQILKALASATGAELRIQLMGLLDSRAATTASGELLKQAADPNVKVAWAALRALKSLAGSPDLPALIALIRGAQDEGLRVAAENAVVGTCLRTGHAAPGSEAVLVELQQTTDPVVKVSWIRILVALGEARALPAVLAALRDANETVAAHAIEELARWPDPAPVEALLVVMRTDANPSQRERALASVIQLATAAADERQRPDETVIAWFQQANQAAQGIEDRRRILSGLGRVKHIESFRLLARYLEDPGLHDEAAVAIVQIAPTLRPVDPAALKAALDKIAATANDTDLRRKAAEISRSLSNPVP